MKKKFIYPLISFLLILLTHFGYSIYSAYTIAKKWAGAEDISLIASYFKEMDFFLGLSYALAACFTVYAFLMLRESRKKAAAGVASGLTIMGLLYFSACFMLGCCGSPMLAVYLGLFGSKFLGFTKPLVFIVTVLSIAVSLWWLKRKSKGCETSCCKEEQDKLSEVADETG